MGFSLVRLSPAPHLGLTMFSAEVSAAEIVYHCIRQIFSVTFGHHQQDEEEEEEEDESFPLINETNFGSTQQSTGIKSLRRQYR